MRGSGNKRCGTCARRKVPDSGCPWADDAFDFEKLKRVARKYGYELVTKLLSSPSFEGVQASESMETMEKTDGDNVEKEPHTPLEVDKLSNSVTSPGAEKLSYFCWFDESSAPRAHRTQRSNEK